MSKKKLSDKEINEALNADLSDLSDFCDSEDDDDVDRDKDYIPSGSSDEESDVEVVPSTSTSVDQIICITVPPPSTSDDSQEMLDNLGTDRQSTLSDKPSTYRLHSIPLQNFSSRPSTSRSFNISLPDLSSTPSTSRVLDEQVNAPGNIFEENNINPDVSETASESIWQPV